MERIDAFLSILRSRGITTSNHTKMLDFGCGDGKLVSGAIARGIDAFGCDINFTQVWIDQEALASLTSDGRVRKIKADDRDNPHLSPTSSQFYRLPFDDETFDIVISDQVLEHVSNFSEVASELYRVMKPGAAFLHIFPSKFGIIEPHINVPFASAYDANWWLKLWAYLGIRNEYERGMSAIDTVNWNRNFMDSSVNYLSEAEYKQSFNDYFDIKFVEKDFLKTSKRARLFLHPVLYRYFRAKVMYGVRKSAK